MSEDHIILNIVNCIIMGFLENMRNFKNILLIVFLSLYAGSTSAQLDLSYEFYRDKNYEQKSNNLFSKALLKNSVLENDQFQFKNIKKDFQIRTAAADEAVSEEDPEKLILAAKYFQEKGDYIAAESLFSEALRLQKKKKRQSTTRIAVILSDLGVINIRLGNFQKADLQFNEALDIISKDSINYPTVLYNYSLLLSKMEDFDKEEFFLLKAIKISNSMLSENNYNVDNFPEEELELIIKKVKQDSFFHFKNSLAALYVNLQRFDEAEKLYLEIFERANIDLGSDNKITIAICTNIGALYETLDRPWDAKVYYEKALKYAENSSKYDY